MTPDLPFPPAPTEGPEFVLHLNITGATPNAMQAVPNIKFICEEYLPGQYELRIIDSHR